ncbi:MAG: ankyrin repeat-containing protein [Candidatus Parcubacteria bacterium]|jgi:ankyrin repeat protein
MADLDYNKTLSSFVKNEDVDGLQAALATGASANEPWYEPGNEVAGVVGAIEVTDWFVLHQAAQKGNLEIVAALTEAGADVNKENFDKETPLFMAVTARNEELIKYLAEKGADLNHINHELFTPLLVSVFNGDLETTKLLIELGAEVNPLPEYPGQAITIMLGNVGAEYQEEILPLLDLLIESGADVNKPASSGWTALIYAIAADLDVVATHLLEKGQADPNLVQEKAGMPMYEAAKKSDGTFLKMLLAHNGNPNAGEGFAKPIFAAANGGGEETVQTLIDAGADINVAAPNGQTPLFFSLQNDIEVTEALLKAGTNKDAKDNDGKTVFDWATKMENEEVLALLAKY